MLQKQDHFKRIYKIRT